MKKLLLLCALVSGAAYSMDPETTQQFEQMKLALQILNTPDAEFEYRCPDCGATGGVADRGRWQCTPCGKQFSRGIYRETVKNGAAQTVLLLQHILPYKK